jgi:Putative prokaryotic signal transducing protein
LKRVFGSFNQTLVFHARNLLQAQGIEVLVRNATLSSALGELPPAETELWVMNDADVSRAHEVLHRRVSGPDWTCGCGETLGAQFTQCWKCGAERRG